MSIGSLNTLQSDPTQSYLLRRQQEMQALMASAASSNPTAAASGSTGPSAASAASGSNPYASPMKVDLSVLITLAQPGTSGTQNDGDGDDAQQPAASSTASPNSTQAAGATSPSLTLGTDVASLLKALATGDSQGTQTALQQLTKDLGSTGVTGHHHHHHGQGAAEATSANAAGQTNAAQNAYQITLSFASAQDGTTTPAASNPA